MHTDWSLFFGRFHPLIVHLPIGIILFAALLTVMAGRKKNAALSTAISIALLAGAISASLAAASGYFLSTAGGYNNNILFWHQWIGISAAILTFIAWLFRINNKTDIFFLKMPISSWLLYTCIFLIAVGGHLGGKMTHGEEYLTRYMPSFLKNIFPAKIPPPQTKSMPVLDSVIVFTDIIQPIFDASCVNCHNPHNGKGELDLTTAPAIQKGGKSGNTIVAGDPEKSELLHRVTLSPQRSKFMPADGHPPLTKVEISFIKSWIQSGADYTKNITASGADEKTKYLIAAYLGIDAENNREISLPVAGPADSLVLRQLQEMKILVRPLTSQSNLLEASLVMVQNAGPSQLLSILGKLTAIRQQLYRLDVSNCGLTKEAINIIAGFSRLNKLEIQQNNLPDEWILPLGGLQQLAILNAGQNNLTDKSIGVFKKLPDLKKINLWQTAITDQGAKELQTQLPGLAVNR